MGDEIIIPEPYWPQYAYIAKLAGAHVVSVDTREMGGRLTPSTLRSAVGPRTRAVILNNPVNPTGVVYSREEIMELLEVTDAHFVFDEVYDRITYTDRFCSILQLDLPDAVRKRISYVNSFSKSFAMTGWRLGYAFVPDWLLELSLIHI